MTSFRFENFTFRWSSVNFLNSAIYFTLKKVVADNMFEKVNVVIDTLVRCGMVDNYNGNTVTLQCQTLV